MLFLRQRSDPGRLPTFSGTSCILVVFVFTIFYLQLVVETENITDLNDYLNFLKHGLEPWTKVTDCWRRTTLARSKLNISIQEYLNSFPVLKLNSGYELVIL